MPIQFYISANFQWGAIFDGNLAIPMLCQVAVQGDYYLIYADIATPPDEKGIDLFQLLNSAFSTGLPADTLFAKNFGFFSFANRAKPAQTGSLGDIFPLAPIPSPVAMAAIPISESTSFWLTVVLEGNFLFNSLIEVGINEGENQVVEISMSGTFSNSPDTAAKSENEAAKQVLNSTIYTVFLPPFTLFGLFTFKELELQYTFASSAKYSIQGTIELDLFGESYSFWGLVSSDTETMLACLSSSDANSTVPSLFDGNMTGVSFANLVFGLQYTYQSATGLYWVQGSVQYGSTLSFSGQIVLQDTTPVLALVSIDQDLSIGDLFNQSVPEYHWPTNLINIIFLSGGSLYYQNTQAGNSIQDVSFACPILGGAPQALPQTEIDYQDGFNIYAAFDITILKTVRILGNVQIAATGVTASIQLADPIPIYILQITGDKSTNGPIFTFSTVNNGSAMGFSCGLLFFQENFGLSVDIQGVKSASGTLKVSGTLSSSETFPPVFTQPPTLSFSYSQDEGFVIKDWPAFDYLDQPIDFIDTLKSISNAGSSSCGKLGDFVDGELLTSVFTISPSFSTKADGLYFVLSGTYTLAIIDTVFATLHFPDSVVFILPDELSLTALPAAIGTALTGAADSFVQGLLDNSDAIASFLALTAGEAAVNYALTLVCQGLADEVVVAATDAAVAALAAAGGLLSDAAAILAAAAAAAGAAGSDHSCFVADTLVTLADGSQCPIEKIKLGDWLLGVDNRKNQVIGIEAPKLGKRLLYCFNHGRYFVTAEHPFMTTKGWRAIDPHATRRENQSLLVGRLQLGDQLVRLGQPNLLIQHIDSQAAPEQVQLYNFILADDHSYYADGYLVHNKGGGGGGDGGGGGGGGSGGSGGSVNPLPPTGLTAGFTNDEMVFSWSSTANASGYDVKLLAPTGNVIYQNSVIYSIISVTVTPSSPMVAGAYTWCVSATKDSFVSAESRINQTCLEAPVLQTSLSGETTADVELLLQWNSISGAAKYQFQLLQGEIPLSIPSVDAPNLNTTFFFDQLPAGEYSFSMRACNDPADIASNWSPVQVWTRLASPSQLDASYSDGAISAQWQPVSGIGTYLLSLYDPDQQLEQYPGTSTGNMNIVLPQPVIPGAYQLYLSSMPDSNGLPQAPSLRIASQPIDIELENKITTAIHVTYVDNELYIIAVPLNGMTSTKIFHYVSGYNDPMNITIIPQHVLTAGQYTLCFVGINWGGPSAFNVTLTTDGAVTPVGPAETSTEVGIVWSPTVQITV